MRSEKRFAKGLLACWGVIVLLSTVAGCGPTASPPPSVSPTVPPTVPPVTAESPTPAPCDILEPDLYRFDPFSYSLPEDRDATGVYLDHLIIVSGASGKSIDDVMSDVFSTGAITPPFVEQIALPGLMVRLYDSTAYSTTYPTPWDIVLAIHLVAEKYGADVYGDPAYVLGDPWDIQGSPWDIQGSPYRGIEGTTALDIEGLYWKLWALESAPYGVGRSTTGGEGVQVVIFDTSPFREPGAYPVTFSDGEPLNLCVSHPVPVMRAHGTGADYSEHGFAVAGLVHAVAPGSAVHLVRVLNDKAEGDLFTLLAAISLFLSRNEGSLDNVVINLSLGMRPEQKLPPTCFREILDTQVTVTSYLKDCRPTLERIPAWNGLGTDDDDWRLAIDTLRGKLGSAGFLGANGDEIPIHALKFLIDYAVDHGAVVVAAAGNDSMPGKPKRAQMPAAWPRVVGVGASNLPPAGASPASSCYSNPGDVYAPGGDGANECLPSLDTCSSSPSEACGYGLISLVTSRDVNGNVIGHQFAYWVGTSFATPLVSGLAARYRQQGVSDMLLFLTVTAASGDKPGPVYIAAPTPVP
jgi:hypothetical protein